MTASQPAVGASFTLRHPVFRLGAILGAALIVVALAWLILANRVPFLERFAGVRNLAAASLFAAVILVPVIRFARSPGRIFLSGALATLILSLGYRIAEGVFPRLGERISAFHVFALGAVLYGLLAALGWVVQMLFASRQVPAVEVAPRRLP